MNSSSCSILELLKASIIMSVICMLSISLPKGLLPPLLPPMLLPTETWSHDPLLGLPTETSLGQLALKSLADRINSSHDASLALPSGSLEYWWSVSQNTTDVCFGSSKQNISSETSTVRTSPSWFWSIESCCRNWSLRSPMSKMSGRSRSFYKKIAFSNLICF